MKTIIRADASASEVNEIFNVSRESSKKLGLYVDLLLKWQKKINLIGPKEISRIWPRHIADALQLSQLFPANVSTVVDLGSGAGFPGIILAVVFADRGVHFHLVESNGKKAAFLREAARCLDIDVSVHCDRIESLYECDWVESIDLVVARALAPLPLLLEFSYPFVEKTGEMLFLKGLDVDNELTKTTKYWNMSYKKYPSRTDAKGCILNIKELERGGPINQKDDQ